MGSKSFEEVMKRFGEVSIDEQFDMIVAIANGGIVPAAIINQRLCLRINFIRINLRDECQRPKYDEPQLISPIDFAYEGKRILLVEDRIKSGATVAYAIKLLEGAAMIKTFAVNGNADYALYDEPCFRFPWIL